MGPRWDGALLFVNAVPRTDLAAAREALLTSAALDRVAEWIATRLAAARNRESLAYADAELQVTLAGGSVSFDERPPAVS